MSTDRSRTIAWVMWVSGLVMIALAAVLNEVNPPLPGQPEESTVEGLIWLSTWIGFGLVGALVVSSRPGNRIGWLMCGITFGLGVDIFAVEYSQFALVTQPGRWPFGEAAAWVATWGFLPVVALVVALVVMYPSGSPSRLGRWVLRGFLFVISIEALVYALRPGPVQGDAPPDNPLGISGIRPFLDPATEWLGTLLAAIAIIAAVDAVLRFRRSSGVERLQFRWFVFAIVSFPIMFLAGNFLESIVGIERFDPVVVIFALWGNGTAVAIGVAITRHGLYEIDRVISRTVGYVLVVGVVAVAYLGAVTGLTSILPDQSQLAVAGSTLAAAALFNPVRKRVQGLVDRRFNRSRYDAQKVMDYFSGSLRDQVDPLGVIEGWVGVVSNTMQPASAGVWVRER